MNRGMAFASLNVLITLMSAIMGFLAVGHYVVQQLTIGRISRGKYAALLAAESGIDSAVNKIAAYESGVYEPPLPPLIAAPPYTGENTQFWYTGVIQFASFQTSVARVDSSTWRVLSTGTYRDGTRARVASLIRDLRSNPGSAAIMANGNVLINGNAEINTEPPGLHTAGIQANGNVTVTGSALVDGPVGAVQQVNAGTDQVFSTHNGIEPIVFPSKRKVDEWKSNWISRAQASGTAQPGINTSMILFGNQFIAGNINLTGSDILQLRGPGTVVVNGNIVLGANARIESSVDLVVTGTVTMSGQSVFRAVWNGSGPTPSLYIFGNETTNPATITATLQGGSSNDLQGIVTVFYGSVRLNGNTTFRGALSINQGSAEITTNGTYRHTFPRGLTPPSDRQYPPRIGMVSIADY